MAQVGFSRLTREWTALSSIITIDENKTYRIQNRGADILLALESLTEPDINVEAGDLIFPNERFFYKKGVQDLYLRAKDRNCIINITSEE